METPATQQAAATCSARATDTAQQQGVSWSTDLATYLRTHPAGIPASEAQRAALVDTVLRQPEAPAAWLPFLEGEVSPSPLLCHTSTGQLTRRPDQGMLFISAASRFLVRSSN